MTAAGRRLAAASCLLALLASTPATAQTLAAVRLFGHRGFTKAAPENSLSALEAAVALGLAGAEIVPLVAKP